MFNIVVLVSGGGSNLQSLIDAVQSGQLEAEITTVIADREAFGLKRAKVSNIKTCLVDRKEWGNKLSDVILERIPRNTDLIVLAGFLSILSTAFISQWKGKIINIHPSLLPDFGGRGMYGIKVHQAVLDDRRKTSGCSVHTVDTGIDTGDIILQREVPVLSNDNPETLQKRVLEQEHQLLVDAVSKIIKTSNKELKRGKEV
jgi:phosphoribosylglycinamide formyltransferase-1